MDDVIVSSADTPQPPRFLLSGPLGSGKSTVGGLLSDRGAVVIDADRVGHRVLDPDGEAFATVAGRWPSVVVDGRIDRAALAAVVFADPGELRALEAITHPAIAGRIADRVASAGTGRPVVVEIPLSVDLLGAGWHRIVVTASAPTRRERAIARGMDPDDVDNRTASQPADDTWHQIADSMIPNDGDIDDLRRAVAQWWTTHIPQTPQAP